MGCCKKHATIPRVVKIVIGKTTQFVLGVASWFDHHGVPNINRSGPNTGLGVAKQSGEIDRLVSPRKRFRNFP